METVQVKYKWSLAHVISGTVEVVKATFLSLLQRDFCDGVLLFLKSILYLTPLMYCCKEVAYVIIIVSQRDVCDGVLWGGDITGRV